MRSGINDHFKLCLQRWAMMNTYFGIKGSFVIYHEVQFPKQIGTGCKKQQTATSDTTHPKSCSFANWGIEDAKLRNRLRGENVTIPTLQGGEKGEAATMCIYM